MIVNNLTLAKRLRRAAVSGGNPGSGNSGGDNPGSGSAPVNRGGVKVYYKEFDNTVGLYQLSLIGSYAAGDVITIKEGSDVAENNAGTMLYNPALVFEEWSCSLQIVDNAITIPEECGGDIYIEATYHPADGKDHFIDDLGNDTESWPANTHRCKRIYYKAGTGTITGSSNNQLQGLVSVTMPTGVSIGYGAFNNCYLLTSINIPLGVTNIGMSAFYSCYSLTNINIPHGVNTIDDSAFMDCHLLTNINIPYGVKAITSSAFQNCHLLASINIPQGMWSIYDYAFKQCYSLTSIKIPQSVTTIGQSAFLQCYTLTSIKIPSSVSTITYNTFEYSFSAREFIFERETPPYMSSTNAFASIPEDCKIYVPDSAVDAYKAAKNWSTYADYIHPISERV